MKKKFQKRVLVLALYAGELMMKSGAEIYRVEDTVTRICKACGIDYVECFATTTGIFLSLDSSGEDSDMRTFIKRINYTSIDLDRISMINSFSRTFTTTDLSVDDGMNRLREIAVLKFFPLPLRLLGAALVGAFICPYYGGDILEMVVAAIASACGYFISTGIDKLRLASFISIFICCLGGTHAAILIAELSPAHNTTAVILSAVTIFMPGVAITNAARDLLSGDMLSGVARATDAVITSIAIAGAAGMVAGIWTANVGMTSAAAADFHPLFFLLFGFLLTIGFCLLFNSPRRQIVLTSVIGAIGMLSLEGSLMFGMSPLLSTFIGTCIVALLAEFASRAGNDATTIFIIPGIIPFVPGAGLYQSMSAVLSNDISLGIQNGTNTLLTAGSIAIAIIVVATGTRLTMALVRRIKARFA